ncbi:hypothetical protein SP90_06715 [Halodesulfovibrio spirochaetisodalis]|uniref:Uncharacterized protein n=1 Tax=Halodesulfovibrio spirochaetisodalis TaxID=1560234 RepID=A0A1B7XEN3_9BACT|nr:hypothetical protein SP90_06715 [Halodesulfovibrio spirochaetisodalis]
MSATCYLLSVRGAANQSRTDSGDALYIPSEHLRTGKFSSFIHFFIVPGPAPTARQMAVRPTRIIGPLGEEDPELLWNPATG